jgi:hypothetical protein
MTCTMPLVVCSGYLVEIILKQGIEVVTACPASGTPASRGVHNSGQSGQQPDHQLLV